MREPLAVLLAATSDLSMSCFLGGLLKSEVPECLEQEDSQHRGWLSWLSASHHSPAGFQSLDMWTLSLCSSLAHSSSSWPALVEPLLALWKGGDKRKESLGFFFFLAPWLFTSFMPSSRTSEKYPTSLAWLLAHLTVLFWFSKHSTSNAD